MIGRSRPVVPVGPFLGLLAVVLLSGCTSSVDKAPATLAVPAEDRPFLISPVAGYPLEIDADVADRLASANRSLLTGSADAGRTLSVAGGMLDSSPGLHGALVLAAQADFVRRDYESAAARVRPVVEELPGYLAARLVEGRAQEKLGDLVAAYEAYRAVETRNSAAAERATDLRPRATQILGRRVQDALAKGKLDDAMSGLERLKVWAPDETPTLQATAAVAAALDDPATELEAVRELSTRYPDDRGLLARRADLEIEAGDAGTGLRMLEDLADRYPDDAALAERLNRAQFRWRLQLLPTEAQRLAELQQLDRADFAVLLFWLFPEVRYGQANRARIANDILDHTQREQIVRVINLGLMDVDPSLHHFEPYRPVTRYEVLAGLLSVLARRQPPLTCLGTVGQQLSSVSSACTVASRCGLVSQRAECLPGSPVSGAEAVDVASRALDLLQSP